MYKSLISLCIFGILLFVQGNFGEITEFEKCGDVSDLSKHGNCEIHEVRITPCKEALEGKPCILRRGKSAVVSFDYTPHFASADTKAQAAWVKGTSLIPWIGLDSNACAYTKCPYEPNEKQTYTTDLEIGRKYPSQLYDVKYTLTNEDGEFCCFLTQIKIK
uniref:Putative ml domain salivary peptide n=1 Tax=Corethrella appendiculata TaxID=1370023 RepID=U5EWD5_9DIPT